MTGTGARVGSTDGCTVGGRDARADGGGGADGSTRVTSGLPITGGIAGAATGNKEGDGEGVNDGTTTGEATVTRRAISRRGRIGSSAGRALSSLKSIGSAAKPATTGAGGRSQAGRLASGTITITGSIGGGGMRLRDGSSGVSSRRGSTYSDDVVRCAIRLGSGAAAVVGSGVLTGGVGVGAAVGAGVLDGVGVGGSGCRQCAGISGAGGSAWRVEAEGAAWAGLDSARPFARMRPEAIKMAQLANMWGRDIGRFQGMASAAR